MKIKREFLIQACKDHDAMKMGKPPGGARWFHLKSGTSFCLVVEGHYATVRILGTNEKKDWWRNLFIAFTQWAMWHPGFYLDGVDAYKVVEHHIKGKTLRASGHSKGGPGAIVMAWKLRKVCKIDHVITLGAPMVATLANFLVRFPVFRLEGPEDIVPDLPGPFLGAKHVGKRIGESRGFLYTSRIWAKAAWLSIKGGSWKALYGVAASHMPSAYLELAKTVKSEHIEE